MENPRLDFEMEHLEQLKKAFNDGYEKGKADAEFYILHCGDTDEPETHADRIRSMSDEELAWFLYSKTGCDHRCMHWKSKSCNYPYSTNVCGEVWLDWLRQEAGG